MIIFFESFILFVQKYCRIIVWCGLASQCFKTALWAAHTHDRSPRRASCLVEAYTGVNVCDHSSTVRKNDVRFGYGITSIAQQGSGKPLGAAGYPPLMVQSSHIRSLSPFCYWYCLFRDGWCERIVDMV